MENEKLSSRLNNFKALLDRFSEAESGVNKSINELLLDGEESDRKHLDHLVALIEFTLSLIKMHDLSEEDDKYLLLSCKLLESRVLKLKNAKDRYFVQLSIINDLSKLGIGNDKCNEILFKTQLQKLKVLMSTFHTN